MNLAIVLKLSVVAGSILCLLLMAAFYCKDGLHRVGVLLKMVVLAHDLVATIASSSKLGMVHKAGVGLVFMTLAL